MADYRVPVLENFSWQQPVISRVLSLDPAFPVRGDRYIVFPAGTGTWTGHDNEIAYYDGGWVFTVPTEGFSTWVKDENLNYVFDGTTWELEESLPYLAITNKSSTYTATVDDALIRCTGTFTLTLPASTGSGKVYYIKHRNPGKVTVAADGSDTIDGSASQQVIFNNSLTIVDGASGEWDII